jgi:tryptophan-rich sensory protein
MSRDLRKFAKQTNTRLILGGILLVLVVGDALIYIFYGQRAALLGFVCLLLGMAPLALILLVFWAIDWLVKRERENQ